MSFNLNEILAAGLDWSYYLLPAILFIFTLFYFEKLVYPLAVFVLVYFLGGYAHPSDITPFHLYLAFGLAYLCYSSSKKY